MLNAKIKLNNIEDINEFLKITSSIDSDVDLDIVDAKSIIGVMRLDISKSLELVIHDENKELLDRFKKWIV